VLRSRESGGSRYHERAWTLSEFVCSASPMTCTEDSEVEAAKTPQAWSNDGLSSHTKAEEALVVEIREHYLAHLSQCRPLWLHPGQSPQLSPDFERTWELFERALGLLQCSVAEDRIRAVYPLLCNVPVDTHEGLVVLVDAVATTLEARAPRSAASRLARRHYHAIVGVAVIDEDEILEVACPQSVMSFTASVKRMMSLRMTSVIRSGISGFQLRSRVSSDRPRRASLGGLVPETGSRPPADQRRHTSSGAR